jgi:hypothetical protein
VVWCVTVHNGESGRVAWTDWTALTSDAGGRDGILKVGSASGPLPLPLTREILALTCIIHPSLDTISSFHQRLTTRSHGNTSFTLERMAHALGRKTQLLTNRRTCSDSSHAMPYLFGLS